MSKVAINKEKIDELLTRGVGEFIDPDGTFRKKLENNPEKIVIKFGVDPTRPDLHLGHAVVLRKLRQFQDMGCKIVFLIGDYTAQIGDPTGKSKVRPEVEQKEVEKNMKSYLDQVNKILKLDGNVFSWIRNSDWFTAITDLGFPIKEKVKINNNLSIESNSFIGKAYIFENTRMQKKLGNKNISVITLKSFLWTLKHLTHSRLIERDLFQDRLNNKEELFLHEMMYPILQGIDSYILHEIYKSCDLEVGGTDQHFNMLVGRDVMKINKQIPQAVLSFKILEGTDGKEKMSKSLDNYIGITDEPVDMYGKIMSIPDSSIGNYFELCTFTSLSEVEKIRKGITDGSIHPKEIKMDLARQIVSIYHGEENAKKSQESWENIFSKKEIPEDILEINTKAEDLFADVLLNNNIISSKSDFRRLVEEKAITNLDTDEKISSYNEKVKEGVYRIGKKRFCKIKVL
jgi:tyrosyl-tRNA synthetase